MTNAQWQIAGPEQLHNDVIAWGQLVILSRDAAPQRIHTLSKKASRKGLSVQSYAPISSPIACLSGKNTAVSAVGRKHHSISERSAIFVSIEAVPRKIAFWSKRDERCVNIAWKYVLFTAVFEGASLIFAAVAEQLFNGGCPFPTDHHDELVYQCTDVGLLSRLGCHSTA